MEIYLARTQGFCAGVKCAIEIVERALKKYGKPIYVYHEIVHNTFIIDDFKRRGVIFIENLEDVPEGSHIIFSAHGVSPSVSKQTESKSLKVIDATCPLVKKVHNQAIRFSNNNTHVILIGHKKHQEVVGTSGYIQKDLLHIVEDEADVEKLDIDKHADVAYLTQTTLSVDDVKAITDKLKNKFPQCISISQSDICYATQIRQDAVKELARMVDIIIVCGSPSSSNSNRLRETGERFGVLSIIIDRADELDMRILEGKTKVGITSGASVPSFIVEELIEKICAQYPQTEIHSLESLEKSINFPLPKI